MRLTDGWRGRYKLGNSADQGLQGIHYCQDRMGMNDRPKQQNCEPLAGIIGEVLQDCQGGEGRNARAVWTFWDRVAGDTIARNAQPAAFKHRILIVHVSNSAWLQELHFRKKALIAELNQAAGSCVVEDILFKIGALREK